MFGCLPVPSCSHYLLFSTILNLRALFLLRRLFHSTSAKPGVADVLQRMKQSLANLDNLRAGGPPRSGAPLGWNWDHTLWENHSDVQLNIEAKISSTRMTIPVKSDLKVVGRENLVQKAVDALSEGSRVLLHGTQGVGKDTVAIQVVSHDEIVNSPSWVFQEWLQGSSCEQLRRQLLAAFEIHFPEFFDSCVTDDEKYKVVRSWLSSNGGWLFVVEDATLDCKEALVDLVPASTGTGAVLFTSQVDLSVEMKELGVTHSIETPNLNPDDAIQIFENMKMFDGKASVDPAGDEELFEECKRKGVPVLDLGGIADEEAKNRTRNKMRIGLLEANESDLKAKVRFVSSVCGAHTQLIANTICSIHNSATCTGLRTIFRKRYCFVCLVLCWQNRKA